MTTPGKAGGGNATNQDVPFRHGLGRMVEVAQANGRGRDPNVRQQPAWAWRHEAIMRFQRRVLGPPKDPGAD